MGGADGSGGNGGPGGEGSGGTPVVENCEDLDCGFGTCDDSSGQAVCDCNSGFVTDEFGVCVDDNECLGDSMCGAESNCVNTVGSFFCSCGDGYVPSGASCVDIDECSPNPCASGASCDNTPGGFECLCPGGKYGDGLFCKDTNACAGNPCGANGDCVNTPSGFACLCDEGYSGSSCDNACATVQFSDSNLEEIVRAAIGKDTGDITPGDVSSLRVLSISNSEVANLDGLECVPLLETLLASGTPLGASGSLDAISQLNRLKALDLSCTAVTDLDFLAEHPSLERLTINSPPGFCMSELTDVSGVTTARQLLSLDLQGHGLTSLSGFGNLKRLQRLYLSQNEISSLSSIGAIRGLQSLYIADNQIASLSEITPLINLRALELGSNPVSDLSSLTTLVRLDTVGLSNLGISSLPSLSALVNLRSVTASFNELTSLASFADIADELTQLEVSANEIESIGPIADTDFRGLLWLGNNPIDCEAEAEAITDLEEQGAQVLGLNCPLPLGGP